MFSPSVPYRVPMCAVCVHHRRAIADHRRTIATASEKARERTLQAVIGRDRGIAVFNPGSIGPRRFALPIVLGKIDITPDSIRLAHIDCETGALWTPPTHAAS